MRITHLASSALGGFLILGMSATAQAGNGYMAYEGVPGAPCNARMLHSGAALNCNPGFVAHQAPVDQLAPIGSYATAPYGYLRSIEYKNTPNVNITRVYSEAPRVRLDDRPSGFTGGCRPETTGYCRKGGLRAPAPRPVMVPAPRPVVAPAPIVRYGKGYDASKFAPRQYGSTELVRGIANIPTSIVDRSPITHIDGVPQPQVRSVTTAPQLNVTVNQIAPRPVAAAPQGRVLGYVDGGSFTKVTPGRPDYWEKVSGMTIVDGLPATKIVCRRAGTPGKVETVNVRRPVIGVPTPIPTAVPVPVRPVCAPVPRPVQMPRMKMRKSRYKMNHRMMRKMTSHRGMPQMAGSRWSY